MYKHKIPTLDDFPFHKDITQQLYFYENANQEEDNKTINLGGAFFAPQFEAEPKKVSFQRIEKLISRFLTELGLQPNQRELVRAFITVSEGNPYFEAAHKDLAEIVYGQNTLSDKAESKRANDKIRNNIRTLLKWQEINKLSIVQIVSLGNRIKIEGGQFRYSKTKYYFSLLDEILNSFSDNSTGLYEMGIESVITNLKEKHQPVERRKSYHPNHKIQKAGRTLLTTIDNIFKWNIEVKSDPTKSCERFLEQLNDRVKELSSAWKEQQLKEKTINDFENLMERCQTI